MPFLKPSAVREWKEDVKTHEEAVRFALQTVKIEKEKRNILVAHQFVTNGSWMPNLCESEQPSVGGLDRVDVLGL